MPFVDRCTIANVALRVIMRRILFIDNWTRGLRHFRPIAERLTLRGVESVLVHKGSWGSEPGRPLEERIQGILTRDIAYYGTRYLFKVFERERPNAVVMLTTNYVGDRAAILAARALQIPTIYLMHGIRATDEDVLSIRDAIKASSMRRLRWQKAGKFLRYIIPNYLYSGTREDALFATKTEPYRVLIETFRRPERWVQYPEPSAELTCTQALVWGTKYKEHLMVQFGYSPGQVTVVGHPPLDPVFALLRAPPDANALAQWRGELALPNGARMALYIDSAFVETGMEGWTERSRATHIKEIAKICADAGTILAIKLHPKRNGTNDVQRKFGDDRNVRILTDANLPAVTYLSDAVIAHNSTAVDVAIALQKPVLVPGWGISAKVPNSFVKWNVARCCNTPNELEWALTDPVRATEQLGDAVGRYIRDFFTVTDGCAMDRIVDAIDSIATPPFKGH